MTMRDDLKNVANAALTYAHTALFSRHIGTLPSDGHLLVLYHNVGVGRAAAIAYAERFGQYQSGVADANGEDYSGAVAFYLGSANPDAGDVAELETNWRSCVNAWLTDKNAEATAAGNK